MQLNFCFLSKIWSTKTTFLTKWCNLPRPGKCSRPIEQAASAEDTNYHYQQFNKKKKQRQLKEHSSHYFELHQKFEKYIPRNETARPRSQFLHACTWERYTYIPTMGIICNLYFLYCQIKLSAQPLEQREWQGTGAKQTSIEPNFT